MNGFRALTCLILTVAVSACSNHWRETNAQLNATDMQNMLAELDQAQQNAQGSGNMADALAVKDDPNASIYYADAFATGPSPMGRIPNVLGFYNYEFLGLSDIGYKDISEARVLFFDAPQSDGSRLAALIFGIKQVGQDQFTYYSFKGDAKISGGKYSATLLAADGASNLYVDSYDVDGGLDSVIQLKLFGNDGVYLGKVATLVGFKN